MKRIKYLGIKLPRETKKQKQKQKQKLYKENYKTLMKETKGFFGKVFYVPG